MISIIAIVIGVTVGSMWRAHDKKVEVPNSQQQTQDYLQKGKLPGEKAE
jgi:hypothetical protein